jgi:hypothetical protein
LLDRFAQFALVAAGEAMEDSGLDPSSDPIDTNGWEYVDRMSYRTNSYRRPAVAYPSGIVAVRIARLLARDPLLFVPAASHRLPSVSMTATGSC